MSAHTKWRRAWLVPGLVLALMAAAPAAVLAQDASGQQPAAAGARLGTRATLGPFTGQVFGGVTSQGWPVVVVISPKGKVLKFALAGLELTCSSGMKFPTQDSWRDVSIGAGGRFQRDVLVFPSGPLTGGSDSVTGKFNKKQLTVSGVWQLRLDFLINGQSDHCDSGPVRFTATR
jgi:hypothetical protein